MSPRRPLWTDEEVLAYGRAYLTPPPRRRRRRPLLVPEPAPTLSREQKIRRVLDDPATMEGERVAARRALERLRGKRGGEV